MKKMAMIMACIILAVSITSCRKNESFPEWVQFYSFEGIQEYVSSVNWRTRTYKYDASRSTYNVYQEISYSQARKSVKDITKTVIPRVKENVEIESFSASYYMGYQKPFQIKYQIDGHLFVFTYSYKLDDSQYSGELVYSSKIGSSTLKLYRKNYDILIGVVKIGKTQILVEVYSDNYRTVHMDYFDYIKISK